MHLSETHLRRGHGENEKKVEAALSGSPVSIFDVGQDDRIFYKQNTEEEGIKSLLSVLIKAGMDVIGVVSILSEVLTQFCQQ